MSESVCQYGHPFTGRYCETCKAEDRAAERRYEWTRHRVPGEPLVLDPRDGWRSEAACRRPRPAVTPDAWFALGNTSDGRHLIADVKEVCAICPVQRACLEYALATRQPWGVWGGRTAAERGLA